MNASTGTFSSEGFPSNYPPNTQCLWQITAPHDHVVKVAFKSFKIQKCSSCTCDVVERSSYVDFKPSMRDCGTSEPDPMYSDDRTFYVKFSSNAENQDKGFTATYSVAPKNRGTETEDNVLL